MKIRIHLNFELGVLYSFSVWTLESLPRQQVLRGRDDMCLLALRLGWRPSPLRGQEPWSAYQFLINHNQEVWEDPGYFSNKDASQ